MMPDDEHEMHRRVDWLRPSDRPILAEFRKYGGWIKPASIHLNVGYSQQHVQERCRELWRRGLLKRYSEDAAGYKLTDLGEKFLDDALTADDLRKLALTDSGPYRSEK